MSVIVVGAGLSGLACAVSLYAAGVAVTVLEAGPVPGGRIRSVVDPTSRAFLADLGPTWVWPPYQPVIARWLDVLDLNTQPQYETGDAVIDAGPGAPPLRRLLPGQHGQVRLTGGTGALIERLLARLPAHALRCDSPVHRITMHDGDGVGVQIAGHPPGQLTADAVVVAIPPRIAAQTIEWTPALPGELVGALAGTPTWMAAQAKAVALYDEAFWRDAGLSGRIASNTGPMVEAHDHCGPAGSPAAIFGFVGWPHGMRAEHGQAALETGIRAQLARCFGADAPAPFEIIIKDWATERFIAARRDLDLPMAHPEVGPAILREDHRYGRVWFAGAETARRSPGLLEGALDAAERTVEGILGGRGQGIIAGASE